MRVRNWGVMRMERLGRYQVISKETRGCLMTGCICLCVWQGRLRGKGDFTLDLA